MSRKVARILMVGLFGLFMAQSVFAEASTSEKSVTGFFRRLFNYPGKAASETASMTANTVNNTGEKVLAKTGENISKGDVQGVVTQPVVGTLETAGQTVSETAQVPVKAAEEKNQ